MSTRETAIEFIPKGSEPEGGPETVSDDADVQGFFNEFFERSKETHADVRVGVYKMPTNERGDAIPNGKPIYLFAEFLDRMTFDEIVERIKKEYMLPGERRVTIRLMASQPNKKGLLFNRLCVIEKSASAANEPPPASQNSNNDILATVNRMLAEQRAATEQIMMRVVEGLRSPVTAVGPSDPMMLVKDIFGMMQPILAAAAGRAPSEGGSLRELMELLTMAKTLVGTGGALGGTAPAEDNDSTGRIVEAGLKALPSLIQVLNAQKSAGALPAPQPVPTQPTPTQPIGAPPGAAPSTGVPQGPEHSPMYMELAQNLGQLADLVALNGPENMKAAEIADLVSKQLPETLPPDVDALIFDPTGFDRLAMLQPKIKATPPVEAWFRSLLEEIRKIYSA